MSMSKRRIQGCLGSCPRELTEKSVTEDNAYNDNIADTKDSLQRPYLSSDEKD